MRKTKRMLAVALAATMVFGSSLTAFADEPVTSGGTDGSGTSEGHVEKELINVVLPTVPAGSTPFAYTMDPERLIQETEAAKYAEGTVFPEEDDTGVYFLTAENTYANTSNTLQAINKSSCPITLTVKVKTTQNTAKDIALATSSTVATTGTPNLYLGLTVGGATTVISAEEQTITKNIAGVPSNFEVAVQTNAETGAKSYVYQEKASATTWKAMNLSMEGAVSNLAIESDTTAPTVSVTWSYAKAADGAEAATDAVDYSTTPAAPTIAGATSVAGQAYDYTAIFTKGTALELSATGLTAVTWSSTVDGSYATSANISVNNGTATIAGNMWASAAAGDERFIKVTIGEDEKIVKITIATE